MLTKVKQVQKHDHVGQTGGAESAPLALALVRAHVHEHGHVREHGLGFLGQESHKGSFLFRIRNFVLEYKRWVKVTT